MSLKDGQLFVIYISGCHSSDYKEGIKSMVLNIMLSSKTGPS
jgi:hypothetical protein